MKRSFAIIPLFLLALPLYACTVPKENAGNTGTTVGQPNTSQTAEQQTGAGAPPASMQEHPEKNPAAFNYASLEADALIRLDEDPRLASPLQTVVGSKPQDYTIFFREPMNKASAEQALRANAEKYEQEEEASGVMPTFAFNWADDQQLHLNVTVPEGQTTPYANQTYMLNVTGSMTRSGKSLEETPHFLAVVEAPNQLWKVSLDGSIREPLTSFEQPYFTMKLLDEDQRYLLVSRFHRYCECDAYDERIYSIYDLTTNTLEAYPLELVDSYQGKGDFVADTRGFFYNKPKPGMNIPEAATAIPIKLADSVYGSGFSKDRAHLFMAVGKEEQTTDFDLLVKNLRTGEEKRYSQALKGRQQTNEVNDSKLPIVFSDDGTRVTFATSHPSEYKELRYQYEWGTSTVSEWKPPLDAEAWSGYSISSDGLYQLYANAGLYKGEQKIDDTVPDGKWLSGTHQFVYVDFERQPTDHTPYNAMIRLYDADTRKARVIAEKLLYDTTLVGSSKDGQWIYLQSKENLRK